MQQLTNTGLCEKDIAAICAVFTAFPKIEKVILYGSRAKGNYRVGSDIDLTLQGTSLNYSDLVAIDEKLDDLLLPYTIDLSLLHQIENNDLIDHIRRVGKIFYESPR